MKTPRFIRPTRLALTCAAVLLLVTATAACSRAPVDSADTAQEQTAPMAGLSGVWGSRLGRTKVATGSAVIEVTGTATERDLVQCLLLLRSQYADESTLTVTVLLPQDDWALRQMRWDTVAGRLERWEGLGGEPMVKTYPAGTTTAFSSEAGMTGVMDSGADLAAMRAIADGKEEIAWIEPDE